MICSPTDPKEKRAMPKSCDREARLSGEPACVVGVGVQPCTGAGVRVIHYIKGLATVQASEPVGPVGGVSFYFSPLS